MLIGGEQLFNMKKLILLGASGSIGKQSLDVLHKYGNYSLVGFSVGNNVKVIPSILKNHPEVEGFYLKDTEIAKKFSKKYPKKKVFSGEDGLIDLISNIEYDALENALVGFVGLLPTITALRSNKTVLLANKESLVVGGEIINNLLNDGFGKLIPIDSEHVAISKCLDAKKEGVKELIITASGGAFRSLTREECALMKKEDALRHPTWTMGPKITIDSATMMNKTFEIIEAYYLFHIDSHKIKVILHDKSYVHSMVSYSDGFTLADISKPDMRNPIAWALSDKKLYTKVEASKNISEFGNFNFFEFDIKRYPLVKYAFETIKNGGLYGTVLNASNEIAVYAFLNGEISFLDIDDVINHCMSSFQDVSSPSYEVIKKTDEKIREEAKNYIRNLSR